MTEDTLALLTPDDAAAALGCAAGTLRDLLAAGKLPGVKYGRDWRIPSDALRQHLADEAMKNIGRRLAPEPKATLLRVPRQRRAPPALPQDWTPF